MQPDTSDAVRRIRLQPYREGCGPTFDLTLWDSGRWDQRGCPVIRYDFRVTGSPDPLFEGEDFAPGAGQCIDSDATVAGLLGFLTLRPGDTDAEYFDSYTPAQMAYAEEHAESLSIVPYDVEEGREPDWENLDGWTTE